MGSPFLICTITLSSNLPSRGLKLSAAARARSFLGFIPIHVMVVDEAAIEDESRRAASARESHHMTAASACVRLYVDGANAAPRIPPSKPRRPSPGQPDTRRRAWISTTRSPWYREDRRYPTSPPTADYRSQRKSRHARPTAGTPRRCAPGLAGSTSGASRRGLALTLSMEQPLMPSDASNRPVGTLTRLRSGRACRLSQKIERPP